MPAVLTFNPMVTTNAPGSFNIESAGYIQGTALNDPAIRNALASGSLDTTETLPMWGGVAIEQFISQTPGRPLGGRIRRATSIATLTGFSVFDQNHSAVTSPQSPVPLVASGMTMNFYKLGSNARIAVAMDSSLLTLVDDPINTMVSWDFNNSVLQPYVASGPTEAITSMTWSATNGGEIAIVMTAPSVYGLGDVINISGATNTGTGGAAAVNGSFTINTYTDTTHFTVAAPAAVGVIGTIAGTPVINVGTGVLPVKVLDVQVGNSMTVHYDPATGFATWDRNGSTAIIQI